jgi:hypothetical protein
MIISLRGALPHFAVYIHRLGGKYTSSEYTRKDRPQVITIKYKGFENDTTMIPV